jgi:hypothetical protein
LASFRMSVAVAFACSGDANRMKRFIVLGRVLPVLIVSMLRKLTLKQEDKTRIVLFPMAAMLSVL